MDISYLDFGEGKQTIVFLHGWQQDKKLFSPLVPFLWENYHLYLVDLPGFGQSDSPPNTFTSFDYANSLVNWLKQHKLNKIILVGHSFGGKVASIVAAKFPHFVLKLVLIAASGIPHPKPWYPLQKLIPGRLRKVLAPLVVSRDYQTAGRLLPIFKNIVKENLEPIFSKIRVPTLIIWGKGDEELPLEDGIRINQLIKESKLTTLGGDHFPFIEDPQKVAALIDNFIRNEKI